MLWVSTGTHPCDDSPRQDGEPSERQLLHCVFACAVIAVVVSDGGIKVVFSCTPPRAMPSHGVVRSRDNTSTRQLVHDNAAPSFLHGLMPPLHCKSGCFSTLICCISKSTTTFTSCCSGTFQRLDECVHTLRSRHLAHAARCCCWSLRLIDTALDRLHERPSDLHWISWNPV